MFAFEFETSFANFVFKVTDIFTQKILVQGFLNVIISIWNTFKITFTISSNLIQSSLDFTKLLVNKKPPKIDLKSKVE